MTRRAWHFTGSTLCGGLYASVEPFDSLWFARGPILHSVECAEVIDKQQDKFMCRSRTIVASKDMTAQLRRFACDEALRVLAGDAPDVVRWYLVKADESLRQAARKAAWAAVADVAWTAAAPTAWEAALDTVWEVARQQSAARVAAWDAAWDAELAAARVAARKAAFEVARQRFNAMVEEAFT